MVAALQNCVGCGGQNDSGGKFCSQCRFEVQKGKGLFECCKACPADIDARVAYLSSRAKHKLPLFDPLPPWVVAPLVWDALADFDALTIEQEVRRVLEA